MQYFFDTSAFVKYLHEEAGTDIVKTIFAEAERTIRISSLGYLETQAAFAIKVRTHALSRSDASLLRAKLVLDVSAGEIEVFSVDRVHFAAAERLIGRHAFTG